MLYRYLGFHVLGRRPRYYSDGEDALVMWAEEVDTPAYRRRLTDIEAEIPGGAIVERSS